MRFADELAEAVVSGDAPAFDPFTGRELFDGLLADPDRSPSAAAGFEAPRFCQLCGRRMVVRINPMGWEATCSRHGVLESTLLER